MFKKATIVALLLGALATQVAIPSAVRTASANERGMWSKAAPLTTTRYGMTATLLSNGKVLVVGGIEQERGNELQDAPALASSEVYDPDTGNWTPSGSLTTGRWGHTATLLVDGRVLVVGGRTNNPDHPAKGSAEIYDPATGKWTVTGALNTPRAWNTITLLQDGKVLVTGGAGPAERRRIVAGETIEGLTVREAELYDPANGKWTYTGATETGRYLHTATLLKNGKVLVAGGAQDKVDYPKAGLYGPATMFDPRTEVWGPASDAGGRRRGHSGILLESGKVLLAGGFTAPGAGPDAAAGMEGETATVELYDPQTDTWSVTDSLPFAQPTVATAMLENGDVLAFASPVSAPNARRPEPVQAFTYDEDTAKWTPEHGGTDGTAPRVAATVTVLDNGKALVLEGAVKTAYIYTPAGLGGRRPLWQWGAFAALLGTLMLAVTIPLRRRSRRRIARAAPMSGGFGTTR